MPRYRCNLETRFGPVLLASDGEHLTGFWFEGQKDFPAQDPGAIDDPRAAPFPQVRAQFAAYEAGQRRGFDLPVAFSGGTPFQRAVWHALLEIPQGRTVSYAQLAARIGRPKAVRAVGAAVGKNPISVIVPCHRVVGTNGTLTGYAGGVDRKRALLLLEEALPAASRARAPSLTRRPRSLETA